MTVESRKNLAASVLSKLLAQARETGDDDQFLVTRYVTERFLNRLGVSRLRDRFALRIQSRLKFAQPLTARASSRRQLLGTAIVKPRGISRPPAYVPSIPSAGGESLPAPGT